MTAEAENAAGTETTEKATPSLEELASQFEPQQSQPEQRIQPQAAESQPEFESAEDALKWMASQQKETRAQLRQMSEQFTKREQDEFVKQQMEDLDMAVKTIGEDVDLDGMLIEGALHVKYNRDKNFQKIFDNRQQNPGAYKQALRVVAAELKTQSSVRHDPQLAENSRALDQLQKSSRSGTSRDNEEPARDMSAGEFDHYWENLLRG